MEMSEDECIMLAGIPNAPSVYNPVDNPVLAAKRQQQVRTQMLKMGSAFGRGSCTTNVAPPPEVSSAWMEP